MCNKVSPKSSKADMSLGQSMRPLMWLNMILGLTVFEIPAGRPWPKISILYSLARSVAYGFILWYGATYLLVKRDGIQIMVTVYKVILIVNIVIAAISTVIGFLNYKKFKEFLRKITLVDETLEIFGIDPEYASALKENLRTIFFWSCGGVIIFASDFAMACYIFKDVSVALIRVIAFEFPLLLNPIVELNFIIKVSTLGKRFERLNALIQSLTPTQPFTSTQVCCKYQTILKKNQSKVAVKPNYYQRNRSNIQLLLKTARQLHLDLCSTSREVNDGCSKQMSMQMAATFLLFTGFSYCLYIVYNEPSLSFMQKIEQYTSFGIWIIVSIIRMIYIVRTSVNVATEAQKTSQIAHEIQVSRTQNKLIDEIHQLSLQIMQHPLYFTASGLIVLDFNYVRGFVGSVTTYLMILIQNQPDMIKVAHTLAETASGNNTNQTNT